MSRSCPLERVRNIGIMAHIDAGKTTLSERILFYTGKTHRLGEVHDGQATLDWMPQEQERGITITSAATTVFWRDHQINLIDTPGHVDFTAEVERSLRVLDGVIGLFCAVGGVEPQTITVWRQAEKYRVPRIAFINKMDRTGADFFGTVEGINRELGAEAVPLVIPLFEKETFTGIIDLVANCAVYHDESDQGVTFREEPYPESSKEEVVRWRKYLFEKISETDETLLEKFCHHGKITPDEVRAAVRKATREQTICPVLCGSAFKNKGVQRLLDAVVDYLPNPLDLPPVTGQAPDGTPVECPPRDDSPLAALAFKVVADQHASKLVYLRVYSGTLVAGSYVYNVNEGKKQRVGRLLKMHANRQEMVDQLYSGEIGAAIGLAQTVTGHTLCDEARPVILSAMDFPAPVISLSVAPADRDDRDKLSRALRRLMEEDPTFIVSADAETEETIISGMGELHLEILLDRLQREFNVGVKAGFPQVAYRETVNETVEINEKHVKQTGGHGEYAQVVIRLEPRAPGEGFEFTNQVKGGAIPIEFVPSVERGLCDAMRKSPWAGFPVVDVGVTLVDGSSHDVDSSDRAFRFCAAQAFRRAFLQARPQLLEPLMSVAVVTPDEYAGTLMGHLASKRGKITGQDRQGNACVIKALVPLAGMFGYVSDLRTQTQGRATFTMQFDHYEPVPVALAEEIIKAKKEKDGKR